GADGVADAGVVPDTAMHSLAWLDELEEAAATPVLTANQVTVWEGVRLLGPVPDLPAMGSLVRAGRARVGDGAPSSRASAGRHRASSPTTCAPRSVRDISRPANNSAKHSWPGSSASVVDRYARVCSD